MIKRFIWFIGGTLAGVAGTVVAGRRVKRRVRTLAPVRIAQDTSSRLRGRIDDLGRAVDEGRQAMHVRERELRARIEGRSSTLSELEGPVTDADALLVDGQPIEPGRVVVLHDVADQRHRRRPR